MRGLANKTQESTQRILEIISNIQKDTSSAVTAIDKIKSLAYENQNVSEKMTESMALICQSITVVTNKNEAINTQMH